MLTYAVGDIHGRSDLLHMMIEKIKNDRAERMPDQPARVIFLGDFIDRGPDSKGVIETLMSEPLSDEGFEQVCLKGNHEDLMLAFLERDNFLTRSSWFGNGGDATVDSYGDTIPKSHKNWIEQLPLIFVDGEWAFVHAGISENRDINKQLPEVMLWARLKALHEPEYTHRIIHGHTIVSSPTSNSFHVNVDTGGYYSEILTAAVVDTSLPKTTNVEFIDVRNF
jgi:serine/threonine protein phosphatase 1